MPTDRDEAIARYARFLDNEPIEIRPGVSRIALNRGGVVLATVEAVTAMVPGLEVPTTPFIGLYGLLSEDLAATRVFLEGRGFAPRHAGDGLLALTLPSSLGGTWLLAEDEAAFPWSL